jgi:hypothetical protein
VERFNVGAWRGRQHCERRRLIARQIPAIAMNGASFNVNRCFVFGDFAPVNSKAPPDERGGNRHAQPNATAPHPDSTHCGLRQIEPS